MLFYCLFTQYFLLVWNDKRKLTLIELKIYIGLSIHFKETVCVHLLYVLLTVCSVATE